jgi:hypothetical protein
MLLLQACDILVKYYLGVFSKLEGATVTLIKHAVEVKTAAL